jgi:septum formation protein
VTLQAASPPLVLASASATRLALLRAAGFCCEAVPAAVDEAEIRRGVQEEGGVAADAALLLAELKATRVSRARPEALVIGADQILDADGTWFAKPKNLAEARAQLLALRGRAHELATAVVCQRAGQVVWHHVAKPRLVMREFSEAFLDAYLEAAGDSVLCSVGSYQLEGLGVHLFAGVHGEHAAILGLPLLPLLGFLRQHGLTL